MTKTKSVLGILIGLCLYIPALKGGFSGGIQLLLAEMGSVVAFYFLVMLLTSFKDNGDDSSID